MHFQYNLEPLQIGKAAIVLPYYTVAVNYVRKVTSVVFFFFTQTGIILLPAEKCFFY